MTTNLCWTIHWKCAPHSTHALQDQECRQNGQPLVKYDAMLIYATDEADEKGRPLPDKERSDLFAEHLRERMEAAGLTVRRKGDRFVWVQGDQAPSFMSMTSADPTGQLQ